MIIKITCSCGASFEVRKENLTNQRSFVCQNCGFRFPSSISNSVKDLFSSLKDFEKSLTESPETKYQIIAN